MLKDFKIPVFIANPVQLLKTANKTCVTVGGWETKRVGKKAKKKQEQAMEEKNDGRVEVRQSREPSEAQCRKGV